MLTVTLSTRLKELRQKQGLTQMQLGQKARLTPQFISAALSGVICGLIRSKWIGLHEL